MIDLPVQVGGLGLFTNRCEDDLQGNGNQLAISGQLCYSYCEILYQLHSIIATIFVAHTGHALN